MARPTTVALGRTELRAAPLALGTWAWGEREHWGYGAGFGPSDVVDAFLASVENGVTLFDTAEAYAHGESEKILGYMLRRHEARDSLLVATKFALLPGRSGARSVGPALQASLKRLGLARIDLYQLHWPDRSMASIESLMDAMADAHAAGLVRAVGVSNCSAEETRAAHAALARRGIALATNQIEYSLLHRAPESDGVLEACRELGVTVLAYSPLAQGVLTGRYTETSARPPDRRGAQPRFAPEALRAAGAVVREVQRIAAERGARAEQVALAWLMAQPGVLPIAGAKTREQAAANAGALGLTLTTAELAALDECSTAFRQPR